MQLRHARWAALRGFAAADHASAKHGMTAYAQGHFQIFFSTKYCPLFRSKLPVMSRLLYCSGVWAYCVNAVLTPIFMVRVKHHRPVTVLAGLHASSSRLRICSAEACFWPQCINAAVAFASVMKHLEFALLVWCVHHQLIANLHMSGMDSPLVHHHCRVPITVGSGVSVGLLSDVLSICGRLCRSSPSGWASSPCASTSGWRSAAASSTPPTCPSCTTSNPSRALHALDWEPLHCMFCVDTLAHMETHKILLQLPSIMSSSISCFFSALTSRSGNVTIALNRKCTTCVQAPAGALVRGPGQPAVLVDLRQGLVAQLH